MKNAVPENWIASIILSRIKKITKFVDLQPRKSLKVIGIQSRRHFVAGIPPNISTKPSKILDFSLLSLTCEVKFFDSELESCNFKIYWEKLSPRSLHFRGVFRDAVTFRFNFLEPKIGIFGIFSPGDVSHPTFGAGIALTTWSGFHGSKVHFWDRFQWGEFQFLGL